MMLRGYRVNIRKMIFNGNRWHSEFFLPFSIYFCAIWSEFSKEIECWSERRILGGGGGSDEKQVMYKNIMMQNEKRYGSRNCAKFTYKYNFIHIRQRSQLTSTEFFFVRREKKEKSKYWKIIFYVFLDYPAISADFKSSLRDGARKLEKHKLEHLLSAIMALFIFIFLHSNFTLPLLLCLIVIMCKLYREEKAFTLTSIPHSLELY